MSIKEISNIEGRLLNIIDKYNRIEWRRYGQRIPEVWIQNHFERKDCSNIPPFIAFRFENESKDFVEKLRNLIDNYQGLIKWELHEHKRENLSGTNWVIRPLKVSEVIALAEEKGLTSEEYLAQYDPKFGSVAFDDLNGLTQYIEENL